MDGEIHLFFVVQLILSELILVDVADVSRAHLLEQFRTHLLH